MTYNERVGVITAKVDRELIEKFRQWCSQHDTTASQQLREWIKHTVEDNSGNPDTTTEDTAEPEPNPGVEHHLVDPDDIEKPRKRRSPTLSEFLAGKFRWTL